MGIAQQNTGTFNGTSFTVSLPSASSASNLIFIIVSGNTIINTPANTTLRTSQVNWAGYYVYDRAGGASSWDFTCGAGLGTWYAAEIQSGAFQSALSQNDTSGSVQYATPILTPTAGTRTIFAGLGSLHDAGLARTISGWTNGFIEQGDVTTTGGDSPMQGVAVLDNLTASGSTPYDAAGTFSLSSIGRSSSISSYVTTASGGGTTPVSKTVATSWSVRESAFKTSATTWGVRSGLSKTAATSWSVLTPLSKGSATSWSVRASVPKTSVTAWDIRTVLGKTSATSWDVASALTGVTRTAATTWSVRNQATATSGVVWDLRAGTTKTAPVSWSMYTGLTQTTGTIWAVRALATQTLGASWDVNTTAKAAANFPTTWGARSLVTTMTAISWDFAEAATFIDIDVTATIGDRRWSATLNTTQRTATIDRRWKGRLL